MLNMRYVNSHIDEIKRSLKIRHNNFPINELLELYKTSIDFKKKLDTLNHERNKGSKEISKTFKTEKKVEQLREIKEQIKVLEEQSNECEEKINVLLLKLPNLLDQSVPEGATYEDSPELKVSGKIKNESLENFERVLEKANLTDTATASELTGRRFYFLKNDFVLLEYALIKYALDFLSKRKFLLIEPPLLLREKYYQNVVDIAKYKNILYKVISAKQEGEMEDSIYLIASSEHIIASTQAGKLLPTNSLPIKYASTSICFRNEPQTKGKDLQGLFKVHQFNQVDQFAFCKEDESNKIFDELQKNQEEFVQTLDLPYKVFAVCSGDLSIKATKALDLKVYVPSEKTYKEYGYCANLTDWQSRRLDTRYDDGERKYVHTVTCTMASFPRILIYLLQNNMTNEGFMEIPSPLISYMGKSRIKL